MKVVLAGSAANERRTALKAEHWPSDLAWLGPEEKGFFCGPRSLSFVLCALSKKSVSGQKDLTRVYVDLLANHMGQGIVELGHGDDHAFACGFAQERAWRDRMHALEDAGFIKTIVGGNRKYAKVLLIHPSIAMQALRDAGKISDDLWNAYRDRQLQAKEKSASEVSKRERAKKKK